MRSKQSPSMSELMYSLSQATDKNLTEEIIVIIKIATALIEEYSDDELVYAMSQFTERNKGLYWLFQALIASTKYSDNISIIAAFVQKIIAKYDSATLSEEMRNCHQRSDDWFNCLLTSLNENVIRNTYAANTIANIASCVIGKCDDTTLMHRSHTDNLRSDWFLVENALSLSQSPETIFFLSKIELSFYDKGIMSNYQYAKIFKSLISSNKNIESIINKMASVFRESISDDYRWQVNDFHSFLLLLLESANHNADKKHFLFSLFECRNVHPKKVSILFHLKIKLSAYLIDYIESCHSWKNIESRVKEDTWLGQFIDYHLNPLSRIISGPTKLRRLVNQMIEIEKKETLEKEQIETRTLIHNRLRVFADTSSVVGSVIMNNDDFRNQLFRELDNYKHILVGLFESDKNHQRNVLLASIVFLDSNKKIQAISAFVKNLENNLGWYKSTKITRLIRQIVFSYPSVRYLLEARCEEYTKIKRGDAGVPQLFEKVLTEVQYQTLSQFFKVQTMPTDMREMDIKSALKMGFR